MEMLAGDKFTTPKTILCQVNNSILLTNSQLYLYISYINHIIMNLIIEHIMSNLILIIIKCSFKTNKLSVKY